MNEKNHRVNKLKNLPLIGSIISAITASLCCTGPVVLALLGVGGAGLFSKFANLHPYLRGFTFIFLGTSFYLTFRKKKAKCEDGACKIRRVSKLKKIILMAATILVVFFLAFPYLLNLSNQSPLSDQTKEDLSEVEIPVEGMTCSGCEFNVERAIKKLDGIIQVKANHKEGDVYVKFEKRKVNVADMIKEINKTGYKAIKPKD